MAWKIQSLADANTYYAGDPKGWVSDPPPPPPPAKDQAQVFPDQPSADAFIKAHLMAGKSVDN